MSDLAYSKKLCGLKKYFINYRDKGRWNPLFPRVEIKTAEMAAGEKTILSEFFTDYLKDITINSKKLLAIHPPKTEAWSNLNSKSKKSVSMLGNKEDIQGTDQDELIKEFARRVFAGDREAIDSIDDPVFKTKVEIAVNKMNESVRPHLLDAQMWVMKEMVRLSCKYGEKGDYGLEGYFRSCFKEPWEITDWRYFIENIDSNVPTWIKAKGNLHEKIYMELRRSKKWREDEIPHLAEKFNEDPHEVHETYHEIINLCLKHRSSEVAKIQKDPALSYDESETEGDDNEISQKRAVLKESIRITMMNVGYENLSKQEINFLVNEIRKPIGEIITELDPSEWKLMDFKYDESFKTNRLIDLDNEIYNKIKTDLKIEHKNDIYNRLKTITKKVIRNFKKEYSKIVEAYNLTDSAIKTMIEDYYFCTRELDN